MEDKNYKNNIIIVEATKDDAEGIIEYCKIIGGETDNLSYGSEGIHQNLESEQKILDEFKNAENKVFFLAKQGDKIVGTANFVGCTKKRMKHRGSIGISVLKSMWGKHIGTLLMEHICDYARNIAKVDIISLEVRSDNVRAIALYTKFGFKKIGTFNGFFKVNGEHIDFDLMNLKFND